MHMHRALCRRMRMRGRIDTQISATATLIRSSSILETGTTRRETVRAILRQSELADAELALFHDGDLDALASNGFLTVRAFQNANPDLWEAVLPGRAALRGILWNEFGASLAEGGPPSKRPRITDAPSRWQSFVQSAAKHYERWEQAEKEEAKKKQAKKEEVEEGDKSFFMAVSGDPFLNFHGGFLIWIRQCYKDLKEIMAKAKASDRFTLLGTSGIGKSYFTIFWICYRATLKEKVVWKVNDAFYLLDFSISDEASSSENAKVAKAYGPFQRDDLELREVFDDPAAWLIIDGEQRGDFDCQCHILVACSSTKEENYHEFSKSQMVRTLYMPAWEYEEIIKFLDNFEVYRTNYSHMDVPIKDEAVKYFDRLGGLPRYVLCARKTAKRLEELETAITKVHQLTLEEFLHLQNIPTTKSIFVGAKEASDCLFHLKRTSIEGHDKLYDKFTYDFASCYVKNEFGKRLRRHMNFPW